VERFQGESEQERDGRVQAGKRDWVVAAVVVAAAAVATEENLSDPQLLPHPLVVAMAAYKLVLTRPGESACNLENCFSSWYNADLSPAGHEKEKCGGQVLRDAGYEFDICFTSVRKRAIRTLWTVLDAIH